MAFIHNITRGIPVLIKGRATFLLDHFYYIERSHPYHSYNMEKQGYYIKPNLKTFQEVYEEWMERRYKDSVKGSTLAKTLSIFKRIILPEFGHLKVDKITKHSCESSIIKWVNEERKQYKLFKNYVSNVLDYATHIDLISENPMKKAYIPNVKTKPKPSTPYYTKDELNSFLESAFRYGHGEKWGTYFHFLAYTGCRKSEGLALYWSDFNFDEKTVNISKILTYENGLTGTQEIAEYETTKNGDHRIITLDDFTIKRLKDWRTQQAKDYLKLGSNTLNAKQLVFSNESNEWIQPSAINIIMEKIIARNRLKYVSPHGLRHSHCSLLFEAGASVKEVHTRLGHRDIKNTLEIYTHATQDKQKETAETFLNYMKNQK